MGASQLPSYFSRTHIDSLTKQQIIVQVASILVEKIDLPVKLGLPSFLCLHANAYFIHFPRTELVLQNVRKGKKESWMMSYIHN